MPHILIVEDEQRMAETLQKGFQKAGYHTTIVATGFEARPINITEFDIVVLDWMLPGFSGLDLLKYWRSNQYPTPVLMLTARDQVRDKVDGFEFGADDYLSKFFEWPELLARVKSLLRRSISQDPKVGPIELDRSQEIFLENGRPVDLTATEYSILKYFFDRQGRLITRSSIQKAIYSQDKNPFSNVVERHIRSIRQKFTYDPITTIRGLGYRLHTSSSVPENQD
jgi:DNA-binding response OmpR family regulator